MLPWKSAGSLGTPNFGRIDWDLKDPNTKSYDEYWHKKGHRLLPESLFETTKEIYLEIGAGTGGFFTSLAERYSDKFFIAIERCRVRGKRLVQKTTKSGFSNIVGVRGNAIPALICGVPDKAVQRLYILYPCPWPKNCHRKQRWYLHPAMPHFLRILKPGGLIVWASDQKFYIDEAEFVCREKYGMEVLSFGEVAPNAYNDLESATQGRSSFESTFLAEGKPCYELIVRKTEGTC